MLFEANGEKISRTKHGAPLGRFAFLRRLQLGGVFGIGASRAPIPPIPGRPGPDFSSLRPRREGHCETGSLGASTVPRKQWSDHPAQAEMLGGKHRLRTASGSTRLAAHCPILGHTVKCFVLIELRARSRSGAASQG